MKNIDVRKLAGTTILASLVVVLDYTMKYSGLKLPFPIMPDLKFDFTGIPIVLSLYLYGLIPGVFTSTIALVAILARSGNLLASSMKAIAELSTVIGIALASKISTRFMRSTQYFLGISLRCLSMAVLNMLIFTIYYVPFTIAFNAIQGSISILGAYFIYEAIKKRAPYLRQDTTTQVAEQ
jgi:riboflavin transporter FmnP